MSRISKTEAASRRARATAEIVAHTGIDDGMIAALVHAFYARVRDDSTLAPIFNQRISNWDVHLARMCDFWSSVVLHSGRYHGSPMQKHLDLPVDAAHFDRWLALFEVTAREICPPPAAAYFIDRTSLMRLLRNVILLSDSFLMPGPLSRLLAMSKPSFVKTVRSSRCSLFSGS